MVVYKSASGLAIAFPDGNRARQEILNARWWVKWGEGSSPPVAGHEWSWPRQWRFGPKDWILWCRLLGVCQNWLMVSFLSALLALTCFNHSYIPHVTCIYTFWFEPFIKYIYIYIHRCVCMLYSSFNMFGPYKGAITPQWQMWYSVGWNHQVSVGDGMMV